MKSLTIGVDFITGRCVAASTSDRDRPEWPPHPGRLFMAMAAAVFETGEDENENNALKWLESLPAPEIFASDAHPRSLIKAYVPVNDKLTVNKSILQSIPGLTRSKQERSFPTTIPLNSEVLFVWPNTDDAKLYLSALNSICTKVIRVGHSSSLVRARATLNNSCNDQESCRQDLRYRWEPSTVRSDIHVRLAGPGELARLKAAFNRDHIDKFVDLRMKIDNSTGKTQQEAKKTFEEQFGIQYTKNLRVPEPTPARLGLWQGYRCAREDEQERAPVKCRHFDPELLILTKIEGRNLCIRDTLSLTGRLRDATMSHCPITPAPAWLSGHDPLTSGPTDLPHIAFLALPFVGRDYADAHVMGLALAIPPAEFVSPGERGRLLGPLFYDKHGASRDIILKLGNFGEWILRLEERSEPPWTLRNRTWVGPSRTWASVTPVLLDRFPKHSPIDDRQRWESEVRKTIAGSCSNSGLPEPTEIDIDTTAWHIGTPRAYSKTRRMYGNGPDNQVGNTQEGFPRMPSRTNKPSRPQIHVFLRFEEPVIGPVLIGAGRFLGYGLCKPYSKEA